MRLKLYHDTLNKLSLQAILILGFSLSTYGADMLPVILDDSSNFCFYKNGWNMFFGSIFLLNNTLNIGFSLLVILSSSYIVLKSQSALLYVGGSAAVWRTQRVSQSVYSWYGYLLSAFLLNACLLGWLFMGFGVWVEADLEDFLAEDDDDDDEVANSTAAIVNGVMANSTRRLTDHGDEIGGIQDGLGLMGGGRLLLDGVLAAVRRSLKKKKKKKTTTTDDEDPISPLGNRFGSFLDNTQLATYGERELVKCLDATDDEHHRARDAFGYANAAISQLVFLLFIAYGYHKFVEFERAFLSDRTQGADAVRLEEKAARAKAQLPLDVKMARIGVEEAQKEYRKVRRSLKKMARQMGPASDPRATTAAAAATTTRSSSASLRVSRPWFTVREPGLNDAFQRKVTQQHTRRRADLVKAKTALEKANKKLERALRRHKEANRDQGSAQLVGMGSGWLGNARWRMSVRMKAVHKLAGATAQRFVRRARSMASPPSSPRAQSPRGAERGRRRSDPHSAARRELATLLRTVPPSVSSEIDSMR